MNFQEVQYAYDIDEWLMDKELPKVNLNDDNMETKIIGKPEIIMTIDSVGRSKPMTACLMVAKKI